MLEAEFYGRPNLSKFERIPPYFRLNSRAGFKKSQDGLEVSRRLGSLKTAWRSQDVLEVSRRLGGLKTAWKYQGFFDDVQDGFVVKKPISGERSAGFKKSLNKLRMRSTKFPVNAHHGSVW